MELNLEPWDILAHPATALSLRTRQSRWPVCAVDHRWPLGPKNTLPANRQRSADGYRRAIEHQDYGVNYRGRVSAELPQILLNMMGTTVPNTET